MEKNPGSFRFQDVLERFFKTCTSWWLNHEPCEKYAQVKLDLLQGEQVNIKKNLKPPSYDSGTCLVK